MLTLFTTPVVYLTLDRMRVRLLGKQLDTFHESDQIAASSI
jgi:multidrug efflux pump